MSHITGTASKAGTFRWGMYIQYCTISLYSTEEACLDPNDPRNAKFLDILQSVPATGAEEVEGAFRLRRLHEKERFVSDEVFANERRFALLEHRQNGVSGWLRLMLIVCVCVCVCVCVL